MIIKNQLNGPLQRDVENVTIGGVFSAQEGTAPHRIFYLRCVDGILKLSGCNFSPRGVSDRLGANLTNVIEHPNAELVIK